MRKLLLALLALTLLASAPASGQSFLYSSLYGSAVLPGSYQVATLPLPAANQGRYAFVTDLGGGADMVLSDGVNWKHTRQGVMQDLAGGGAITLTPLASPPILRITGTSLTTTNVTILTQNLYPGATFRVIIPGTLALLATAGVNVQGVAGNLPLLGGSWQDVQWTGTALVKIAAGTL